MKMLRTLALLAGLIATPAVAQAPAYPQTLPPNTVVGRLGVGPGPAEAIPFSKFQSGIIGNLGAGTFYGNPGASTAAISPWRIQDQASIGTPDKSADLLPIYDHNTGSIKSVQPSALLNSICSTASSYLWNSAGTWVCRTTAQVALTLGLPVSLSLYIPTPTSDDTSAFNVAITDCNNAGGCVLVCPLGATYTISQVSLPSNTDLTGRCTIKQKTSGTTPILISSKNNVRVSGITFVGTLLDNYATNGCGSPTPPCSGQTSIISGDMALSVKSSDNVHIQKNYFTEFGYVTVYVQSSKHVWVESNYLYSNALGIYFYGGNRDFHAIGNTITHTSFYSLTPTADQFGIGISVDTTSDVSNAQNIYGHIRGNTIVDIPYGQAILTHAGNYIDISGNIASNVSQCVAVGEAVVGTSASNINITGNQCLGSSASSLPTESDSGIVVSSGPGLSRVAYVSVSGNVISGFNAVYKGAGDGCIVLNYTTSVSVTSNVCFDNYGNGIVLGANEINVLVNSNIIDTITTASTQNNGIWAIATATGLISSNLISSATNGVKIDGTTTNIKYTGLQQCLSVTTCTTP